jgi:hypothetical protein
MIVFNGFGKVSSFIFTRPSRICRIDMIWVNAEDSGKVINALINLSKFLKGTSSDIVSPRIGGVELHELIAVLNRFSEASLLEERRGSDEESLLMSAVFLELLGANRYQIVHIKGLGVKGKGKYLAVDARRLVQEVSSLEQVVNVALGLGELLLLLGK